MRDHIVTLKLKVSKSGEHPTDLKDQGRSHTHSSNHFVQNQGFSTTHLTRHLVRQIWYAMD